MANSEVSKLTEKLRHFSTLKGRHRHKKMSSSQIYIDIIGNVMLNTEHSDINFLTFPSKDHSKMKGHVCIIIMGEFSLAKITV